MTKPKEIWYRFVDFRVNGGFVALILFEVVRTTNIGVWLKGTHPDFSKKVRWVSRFSSKRFAYPTIEEAKESYLIRKRYQIGHLQASLDHVNDRLKEIEKVQYATWTP